MSLLIICGTNVVKNLPADFYRKMEIGAEISHKIRSAIKAKLIDLGAYVDDELPDYIMVMVANKKTPEQMVSDLNLFLGGNTDVFTKWLQNLLGKLKSITTGSGAENEQKEVTEQNETKESPEKDTSKTEKDTEKKPQEEKSEEKKEDADVLEVTVRAENDEFQEEEIKENNQKKENKVPPLRKSTTVKTDTQIKSTTVSTKPESKVSPSSVVSVSSRSTRSSRSSGAKPAVQTSKVKPVVQKKRTSVIGSIVHHSDSEEEYDPYNPSVGSVASVVRVTERKSSIPKSMQPKTTLLKKAMQDAETSVSSRRLHLRGSESQGSSRQSSRSAIPQSAANRSLLLKAMEQAEESVLKRQGQATVIHRRDIQLYSRSKREELLRQLQQQSVESDEDNQPEVIFEDDSQSVHSQDGRIVHDLQDDDNGYEPELVGLVEEDEDERLTLTDSHIENRRIIKERLGPKREPPPLSPRFVVTLDGVNPDELKDSVPYQAEEEDVEETEEEENVVRPQVIHRARKRQLINELTVEVDSDGEEIERENNTSPVKRPKLQQMPERCKFWPGCKNGEECPYHHPTSQCKTFPKCKFGDKCLFIHPNCKFDANCTRKDCPFTHASKRGPLVPSAPNPGWAQAPVYSVLAPPKLIFGQASAIAQPVPIPQPKLSPRQITCKFFPGCTNMNCPFNHPKPCRFGHQCRNKSNCPYQHPSLPKPSQMKWTAKSAGTQEHISERQFSQPTSTPLT